MKLKEQSVCLNIFDSLPEELIKRSTLLHLKKGEFLYQKSQLPAGVYFIRSGLMALTDISPNGSESLLRVFGKHFFIGHRSFVANEEYHANALALDECEILRLPLADIHEISETYPEMLVHITQLLARDLRIAEERFNDITGKRVKSRIIESLIFLKQRQPNYVWTRREIGEFCGATTETVTRTFSLLEKEGLIQKNGRDITIPSTEKLLDYKSDIDLDG